MRIPRYIDLLSETDPDPNTLYGDWFEELIRTPDRENSEWNPPVTLGSRPIHDVGLPSALME